jgi:hypothetical protein
MTRLLSKKWSRIFILIFSLLLLIAIFIFLVVNRLCPSNSHTSNLTFTNSSWIEVPVAINGNSTFGLFDTGANICVVDAESIDKYNVIELPLIPVRVNNKEWSSMLVIRKLIIGDFCFKNVPAISLNLKNNNTRLSCIDSDIIIGTPIIRQLAWDFNFESSNLTIRKSQKKQQQTDSALTLQLNNFRLPETKIRVNDRLHNVLVDLGQTSSVLLSVEKLDSTKYLKINSSNNADVFGSYYYEQYENIADVILGNDTIENIKITHTIKSNIPSLIGLGFLKNFSQISINPFEKQISLHKQRTSSRLSKFYGYGFSFTLRNGTVTVDGIAESSPAQKVGMQFGDTILSINGNEIDSTWAKLDFCSFLNKRDSILNTDSVQIALKTDSDIHIIALAKEYY